MITILKHTSSISTQWLYMYVLVRKYLWIALFCLFANPYSHSLITTMLAVTKGTSNNLVHILKYILMLFCTLKVLRNVKA